eukprot:5676549-Pleurochrysis_carterae.AAC.1
MDERGETSRDRQGTQTEVKRRKRRGREESAQQRGQVRPSQSESVRKKSTCRTAGKCSQQKYKLARAHVSAPSNHAKAQPCT